MLDMVARVTVREAGAGDRDLLLAFNRQILAAHGIERSAELLAQRFDLMLSAPYRVHLLEEDGAVIGSAIWMDMGDHVFVRQFTIDQARRGQGVGARAFEALAEACFQGREVELVTVSDMDSAQAFWRGRGFDTVGAALRRDARESV